MNLSSNALTTIGKIYSTSNELRTFKLSKHPKRHSRTAVKPKLESKTPEVTKGMMKLQFSTGAH